MQNAECRMKNASTFIILHSAFCIRQTKSAALSGGTGEVAASCV